ncbi:DUF3103 family protein [Aquimarina rhabdastrellae]
MKKPILVLQVLLVAFLLFSCQSEELVLEDNAVITEKETSIDKKKLAFNLIDLLQDSGFKANTLQGLQKDHSPGIKLSTLLQQNSTKANNPAYAALMNSITQAEERAKSFPDVIEIPELWLQQPLQKTSDFSNLLVAFAPEGDESEWTSIVAYTLDKQEVNLEVHSLPSVPVLVIETSGFETLKMEVDYMNQELQASGLQNTRFASSKMDLSPTSKANSGLQTTKLDKIRLNNDEEPWISGAAEIYAITSGIKNTNKEPEIKIIPMYYLDHDGTDYYPNQVMLFWDDYRYQAANIQLFEKDSNNNYKSLVTAITNGVFQIIGLVSQQPWVNVLGAVAAAILEATPDEWYTNDDDYVDSFYTIEKNKRYTNYMGARANAKVNLSPFTILDN